MEQKKLFEIASEFQLTGVAQSVKPLGDGFINDTFIVETDEKSAPKYILQRKNKNVFTDIPAMMDNIHRVTEHLKGKISEFGGNKLRNVLTVIPTHDDRFYYLDEEGDYWAVCVYIGNTITYEKAESNEIAYNAGKGIGRFHLMMSDFNQPLHDVLPGFHNMRMRFEQWDEAVRNDAAGRVKSVADHISFIESHRKEMLDFMELIENGTIPKRVVHNDTKISNFLFGRNGSVECVIDLDTVMNGTVLNDVGDALRSITNTGLEDDSNLENVSMNKALYNAYISGYMSEAEQFLTDIEKQYLSFSAKFITFEQVLRFLMDYINGDSYYKIKYPEHNLVRTRAQRRLLESMYRQI